MILTLRFSSHLSQISTCPRPNFLIIQQDKRDIMTLAWLDSGNYRSLPSPKGTNGSNNYNAWLLTVSHGTSPHDFEHFTIGFLFRY